MAQSSGPVKYINRVVFKFTPGQQHVDTVLPLLLELLLREEQQLVRHSACEANGPDILIQPDMSFWVNSAGERNKHVGPQRELDTLDTDDEDEEQPPEQSQSSGTIDRESGIVPIPEVLVSVKTMP